MPPRQERGGGEEVAAATTTTTPAAAAPSTKAKKNAANPKSPPAMLSREAFKTSFLLFQGAHETFRESISWRAAAASGQSAREKRQGTRGTKIGGSENSQSRFFFLLARPSLESRPSSPTYQRRPPAPSRRAPVLPSRSNAHNALSAHEMKKKNQKPCNDNVGTVRHR